MYKMFKRSIVGAGTHAMVSVSTQGAGVDTVSWGSFHCTGVPDIEQETDVLAFDRFKMC